ncbi:PrsW family intramembrane metalloprotease [Streptomyces tritici]|uniref:PrsW family intramembrane metalloprotease n=1 Tax=Streptomyces tritici TaxID=2054410 RepID=UPI003AF0E3CA
MPTADADAPPAAPGDRAQWRYRPRRLLRHRRALRAAAVFGVLALCGLVLLVVLREKTGTEGFLVGLGLAVLPVPLLLAAFRWLDRVDPGPWKNLIFAFAWGAGAAALMAFTANTFALRWIAGATATTDPDDLLSLGATYVAPVVEESVKAGALLLLFLFRRPRVTGLVDGVVVAGFTATGFAFTENVLYLGNAFGEDLATGAGVLGSKTVMTFFGRIVLTPFAHPLFTVCTGIGFGLAAATARRHRVRRVLLPLGGLLLAMGVHALWNGSAVRSPLGFLAVYGAFMVPAFALLTWLAIWSRQRELRTISGRLPAYAAAGWLAPAEPLALSSMRARAVARSYASAAYGAAAGRAVHEYEVFATSLAFLRDRAHRGTAEPDFAAREQELLHHLWQRKAFASPALTYAAGATGRLRPVPPPPPHRDYTGPNPYRA